MICDQISTLIGIECSPVTEDGSIARVQLPFRFDDGDSLPVFIEAYGDRVRFFDDCGVLLHFMGRGMNFEDGRRARFVRKAAAANGVSFSDGGELEVWSSVAEASKAFARYISALLQITAWEREQRGVSTDTTLLVDEVAMCLRAWKPQIELKSEPEFEGISGCAVQGVANRTGVRCKQQGQRASDV